MTLKARKDICGNCLHHSDMGGNNGGQRVVQCRRHPPKVFMVVVPQGPVPGVIANRQGQRQQQMGPVFPCSFPTLDPEFWCSEYKPEEVAVADNDG